MHEVPTVRIASGHPDCDVWCTYPVADRGPALMEYLRRKEAWAYEHVLVIETDYVFVAPLNIELPSPVRSPQRASAAPPGVSLTKTPAHQARSTCTTDQCDVT